VVLALAFPDVLVLGRSLSTGHASGLPGVLPDGPWGFSGYRPEQPHVSDSGCSAWYHDPIFEKIRRTYRKGRLPLWNPHAGVGAPLAADPQSGAFDLLRLPLILTGGPVARDLQLLLRLWLAGVGCLLLLRKLGLGSVGSWAGAALFMLNGHFILNINWGNLGPVLLLPWMAWALIRAGAEGRPGWATLALGAGWLAGMPPSALIVATVCAFLGLIAGYGGGWRRAWTVAGVVMLGAGMAAVALIPAAEYLQRAHSYHDTGDGLRSLPWGHLVASVFPLGQRIWELGSPLGEATYMGSAAWAAFLVAAVSWRKEWASKRPVLTGLGVVGLLVLLKSYGAPVVNELGRLPGLDRTLFYKHAAPVLWLALAAAAGWLVDAAGKVRLSPRRVAVAGAAFAVIGLASWVGGKESGVLWGTGLGVAVAGIPFIPLGRCHRQGLLLLVLLGEALVLVPRDHAERHDTLAAPPYLQHLRHARSCGSDLVLYPNTSTALEVDDVRLLGPVWPARYARFLNEALGLYVVDRFDGSERRMFHEARWVLDFLGVTRLVSAGALAAAVEPADLVAEGPCPSLRPHMTILNVDGEYVRALYHHPAQPGDVPCRYRLKSRRPRTLLFGVGMHPDVWRSGAGDGVLFRVLEGERELFSRWTDPKNRAEDRRWLSGRVSVSGDAALEVTAGETPTYDWALWADPRTDAGEYPLVHRGAVVVRANPRGLPFLRLMDTVRWVDDSTQSLTHTLRREGRSPVAVEGERPEWWDPGSVGGRAELRRRDDSVVEAAVEGGGVLMVRELFYPGWEALIDGKRAPVVPCDYLFRGVVVPPGSHTVVMRFRPWSFRLGCTVSAASLIALGAWILRLRGSQARRTHGTH
jgi:hypothetical protein